MFKFEIIEGVAERAGEYMQSKALGKGEGPYIAREKRMLLFLLCWLAYFAANMGRLSYTASIAEILKSEGITKSAAGLVSTGFFISYGAGQLFSGYFGDKLPPKYMETFGLFFTGFINLMMAFAKTPNQMLVLWCFNGLIQSTLWPPIIRVISECFAPEYRKKACVNISTTYPVATLLSYAASAGLIWLFGWRSVFISCSVLLFAVTVMWFACFTRLEKHLTYMPNKPVVSTEVKKDVKTESKFVFPFAAITLFCFALISQGALRDGLMTWVSPFLTETFNIGTSVAILSTTILPVVNLAGVYGTNFLCRKLNDESKTSLVLFGGAVVFAVGLVVFGQRNLAASLLFFSLVTASMMGVNVMLVNVAPTYFIKQGKVAFVSGLTNSMVYVGSSLSTYGIGRIADSVGWNGMLLSLVALAVFGAVFLMLATPRWMEFKKAQV